MTALDCPSEQPTKRKPNGKRALAFAGALGVLLFATLAGAVVARSLVAKSFADQMQPFASWLPDSMLAGLAIMAAFSALIAGAFYALYSRFERINAALARFRGLRHFDLAFRVRSIAYAGAALLLLWAPIIAIMYPTGLTVDTFNQLYQFQTSAPTYYPATSEMIDAEFIDHHPVFDTLLYGLFWQAGSALGSQNGGLFALVVIQSIVLAGELGAATCYLERLSVPWPLRLASLLFFGLFPLFGHYAATLLKDVTYLTFFIPWSVLWLEACRTRGRSLDDARVLAAFMVLGGLCILAKKLGVFVLVCCLIILVAVMKGLRVRLAASSVATVLVFCLALPASVYPAIGGVAPGGRQEALGPAIQQLCTLIKQDPDALTAEEASDVNKVIDLEQALQSYEAFRTDGAKSAFKSDASNEDVMRFLQIWADQGVRHPAPYLLSTAETAGMLYIPFMKLTYYSGEDLASRAERYAQTNPEFALDVGQPEALVELNDALEHASVESAISDLPIISLFFTSGFYGSWVPLAALVTTLYAKRCMRSSKGKSAPCAHDEPSEAYDGPDERDEADAPKRAIRPASAYLLAGLAPTLVCMAFLIVSPVASPRYVLPLLYTAPLIGGWAWFSLTQIGHRA